MSTIIPRPEYLEAIAPFMGQPVVKVLTGMRRVGKSCILRMLADAHADAIYVDMESLANEELRTYRRFYDEMKKRLAGVKHLVLIDEIQEIDGWEKAVSSLLAEDAADMVITGSNAAMFSGELATLLSGRAVTIEVMPLTLAEFDRFYTGDVDGPDGRFELYMRYGGLPGLHLLEFDSTALMQYLDAIFSAIALKDVIGRRGIRDVDLFERTVRFAYDNIGQLLSCKRIVDYLKSERRGASMETIANHLAALQDAYILHQVRRWDIKGKRHLQMAEKYYAGDVGLRHARIGYRDGDISGILENLVYLELRRRRFSVSVGHLPGAEIDFVAEGRDRTYYIQVAYRLDSPMTMERELAPFRVLRDRQPCRLITMDRLQGGNFDGVERIYLPDFLRGHDLG